MQYTIRILATLTVLVMLRATAANAPLTLEKSIPLPGVKGRIDHMAIDMSGERLFVAALGNDSVEVIDLKEGKDLRSLPGLKEAQGLGWAPNAGKLFVACGGDGAVHVFDGKSLERRNVIQLGDDADNVRFSATSKQIYVGYGRGAIAIIDPVKESVIGEIKISGHPESFELDRAAKHIYVNVPSKNVEVLDTEQMKPAANWKLSDARNNYPMTFDENSKRLFIGCRSPAKILVLDSDSGKAITTLDCPGTLMTCSTLKKRNKCIRLAGMALFSSILRRMPTTTSSSQSSQQPRARGPRSCPQTETDCLSRFLTEVRRLRK